MGYAEQLKQFMERGQAAQAAVDDVLSRISIAACPSCSAEVVGNTSPYDGARPMTADFTICAAGCGTILRYRSDKTLAVLSDWDQQVLKLSPALEMKFLEQQREIKRKRK